MPKSWSRGVLAGAALFAAAASLAATFSNEGGQISPGSAGSGSREGLASDSYRMAGASGEVSASTMAAGSHRLRAGLLQIRSYPGTVTNLTGASNSQSTLDLTWSAPGYDGGLGPHQDGTRYKIQRETDPAAVFVYSSAQVTVSTSGSTSGEGQGFTLTGLSANTTYYAHLWTLDPDGNLSPLSNRTTASVLPVPASNPSFKGVFATSVTLTWTPLPDNPLTATAEGYRLEASSTDFGALTPGGQLYSSATAGVALSTLTVVNLEVGTTYYFRVGSVGHDMRGNFIAAGSTKTLVADVPPSNVAVSAVNTTNVSLSWNSVNADVGYRAEASTAADFTGLVTSNSVIGGGATSLEISALFPNTTYFLRVAALWNSSTNYGPITSLSTPTLATGVLNLQFKTMFITSAALTWTPHPLSPPDASSKTATGYLVEASSNNFGALSPGGVILSSMTRDVSLSTLTVDSLAVNSTYYFRVASLNKHDVRNFVVLGATATLASPPGAGSPAVGPVFVTSITASWDSGVPANQAGQVYQLRASSSAFAAGTVIVTSATANLGDVIPGLLPDTTYQLRVSAVNLNGVAAETVLGTTVTMAQAPVPLMGAVYVTSVAVSWSAVTSQGYRVEASSTNFGVVLPGGVIRSSETGDGAMTGLTVENLDANTTYYFRAASLNWNSHPNYAVLGSTMTKAAAVSGAQTYAVFETSATLNWVALPTSPQSARSEGYRVEASSTNFGVLAPGGAVLSSATPHVALATLTVSGLLPNTTYYFKVGSLNLSSTPNFVPVPSSATLATPVSPSFSIVNVTSITASWTATASQGYELQASINASFSPLIFSSTTAGGANSLFVPGLSADTTYFARVGAINHSGTRNFASVGNGSTSTLAATPVSPFFPDGKVSVTSVTVQWTAVTAQGYLVEASVAPDMSDVVLTSVTSDGAMTQLTVENMDSGTTYYFRVGSLNWNSVSNYVWMGATFTATSPRTWVGNKGAWHVAANWSPSGIPGKTDAVTINQAGAVVVASETAAAIQFSSLTIGSPAGVAVSLTLSTTIANSGDVIIYKNAGLTLGTTHVIRITGDMTLVSGSSLSHRDNAAAQIFEADLNVTGTFDLRTGATMTAVGLGFDGGAANLVGKGPGPGGGTGVNNTGGGGAGHGGAGSAGTGGSAGTANGSATNPTGLGSGGGGGRIGAGTGGAGGGGGGIFLVTAASMVVNGLIDVSGSDGVNNASGDGGGGAGGSVNLLAQVFSGTGTIRAKGAPGGDNKGGGGGGGRVSVNIQSAGSACEVTYDVAGGTGSAASGGSGTVSSTTTIPAPGGFIGMNPSSTAIHWNWLTVVGASAYKIVSSTGGDGQSPSLSAVTTSYTTEALAPNTTHTFVVRASNCGQQTDSAQISLVTLAKTPIALAQSFPNVYQSSASAAWAALAASPVSESGEGYRLEASSTNFGALTPGGDTLSSATVSAALSTLTVSGLLANTTYFFRVASINWAGSTSPYTALGSTPTLAVLVAAEQVYAVFAASITANWQALPASPQPARSEGYRLEFSTTPDFSGAVFSSVTPSVALSTLTVNNLISETSYYGRVGSLNLHQVPHYESLGFVVTKDTTAPGALSNAAALTAASSTTLSLTWSAPGDNGSSGCVSGGRYRVDYASYAAYAFSTTTYSVEFSTSFCPGDASGRLLSGLLPNTTYFARVWALDEDLNSAPLSNGATAPTLPAPVTTLASTFIGVFQTSVTAAWAALPASPPDASSKTAQGYQLEASSTNFGALSPGGVTFTSATTSVAMSTLSITDLTTDVTYYFRVGSLGHNGSANFLSLGSTKTVTFVGAPPDSPDIFRIFATSASIIWTAVNATNGYLLQASTATDFTGGLDKSSSTPNGDLGQLTVFNLLPNSTYFFRVGAQWGGAPSYASSLTSSTLASLVSGMAFRTMYYTSATVTWTQHPLSPPDASSKTAEGYAVEASTASNFSGTRFSSVTADVGLSTLTVTGLAVNTTYFYRVGSLNWQGATQYLVLGASATWASFPEAGAPIFTAVFSGSMTASWTSGTPANPSGTRYLLQGSSSAFAAGTTVVSSNTANLSGTLSGLLNNTTYALRVSAVNRNNQPSLTVLASTATLAAPPQSLAETFPAVYETSATAAWAAHPAAPESVSAEGYELQASSTNFGALAPGGTVFSSVTTSISASTLAFSGMDRNTTYYFRVGALNWNSSLNFSLLNSTATKASLVTGAQTYAVFETSATLNWVALPSSPLSARSEGYRVEASSTNFGALTPGGAVLSSATPHVALATLTVSGLLSNTTYYFKVGSLNLSGTPNFVAVPSSATLATPVSPSFSIVNVTSMTATWTAVTSQGYELQASVNASFSPLIFSSTTAGGANSLFVPGLSADTTYFARVGAINHSGTRNFASVGNGSTSTLAATPVSPFFPSGKVSVTSVTVQWTAVTAQGYLVEASVAPDMSDVVITSATSDGAMTQLTVENMDSGTTYYFRVGSLNWNSVSNYVWMGATFTATSPRTWVGNQGAWHVAANWSPSGIPGKTDAVTINQAGAVVVASETAAAIQFSSLTIGSPAGVAVSLTLSTTIANSGDVIIYKNAGLTLGTTHTIKISGDMTMVSGSSLSHRDNAAAQIFEADLNVTGTFDLRTGATMTAVGLGFDGGAANLVGKGPGPGGGTGVNNTGGGGAGHGGAGSAGTGGSAGTANGSATNPTGLGSGGGGGRIGAGTGGAGGGGGGIFLVTAASMVVNGLIDVSGFDGVNNVEGDGGGGAGGSVNLLAQVFSGTGTIRAKGAPGGDNKGGGGGGGRVSVNIQSAGSACDVTYDVAGGTGSAASGAGGTVSSTSTLQAPGGFIGMNPSSTTIHWNWLTVVGASAYKIVSSTGGDGQSPSLSAVTTSYTTEALAPNTTHTFVVRASDCGQQIDSAQYALATLAKTPTALAQSFLTAYQSSATVAWAALAASPQSESGEGYRLEASSTNFGALTPGGDTLSSATVSAALSTLTVSGLLANTTYFFRVASINWAGSTSPYTALGSTPTLAVPVTALPVTFLTVYRSSVTVNWQALPAPPPLTATGEGYRLEASSTNFGALSPGGVTVSSETNSIAQSTLTALSPALESNTVYYFRVGSLNWAGVPNYAALGSTRTKVDATATISVSTFLPTFANNGKRAALLSFKVTPDLSAANGMTLASVRVTWSDGALAALTNAQAQALFSSMSIIADALDGSTGVYHASLDTAVVANLNSASFALDGSGRQILTVPVPAPALSTAPAGGSRIYFVTAQYADNASAQTPNTARATLDPDADITGRDPPSGEAATVNAAAAVNASSVTAISSAPAATGWPRDLGGVPSSVEGGFVLNDAANTSYTGSNDGRLVALNTNGTIKWSFATTPSGAVRTFPTVANESSNDYAYFANDQGDVYKVRDDGGSGTQIWKRSIGGAFQSAVVVMTTTVYIAAVDGKIYKLKTSDGTDAAGWSYDAGITGAFSGTPYIDDFTAGINSIFVGSQAGNLYRVRIADGTVNSSTGTASGAVIRVTPNLDSGLFNEANNSNILYWGADDGVLRARTSANLTSIPVGWSDFITDPREPINTQPYLSRTNETPKAIYFGCDNGKVYKLNALTGALIWSYQTGGKVRTTPIAMQDSQTGAGADYVYFGSDDGNVYGLNVVTGARRSTFPVNVGAPVRSGATWDNQDDNALDTITVGSMDGKVLRIKVGP